MTMAVEVHLSVSRSSAFRMAIKIMNFVTYFEKTLILKHCIGTSYYN